MKVIIAGSRDIWLHPVDMKSVVEASGFTPTEIVSGTARGVDLAGEGYAHYNNIATALFPAEWDKHGKAAGHIRNREMAEYADALIAVWDGKSPGTRNMIATMRALGKPVYVHKPRN